MTISYISAPINLTDKFTKFLVWEEKQNYVQLRWIQDVKLVLNFNKHSSNLDDLDENQWFIYWLNNIENNPWAKNHLMAYLEFNCYWVIKNFFTRKNVYLGKLSETEKYIKGFNILRDYTSNPHKILKEFRKFNPNYSHIKTYSQRWLYNLMKDSLNKEYGVAKYSYWGLLKNTTKNNLKSALNHRGYSQKEINSYLLLWQCFQEVYGNEIKIKKGEMISEPTLEKITKIVGLYKSLINIDSSIGGENNYLNISTSIFQKIMRKCHNSLVAYEKIKRPSAYAYNLPLQSDIDNNEDAINSLSLENILFKREKEEIKEMTGNSSSNFLDKQELNLLLVEILQKIKENDQHKLRLLTLNYGLGLRQTTIAQLLDSRQDKISKEKGKLNETIFQNFVQVVESKLSKDNDDAEAINLNTPPLNTVNKLIENWLTNCYKKPLYAKLQQLFVNLSPAQKKLLKLTYGGDYYLINEKKIGLDKEEIAIRFQVNKKEIENQLNMIKKSLQTELIQYINCRHNLKIDTNNKQVIKLVETWLKEAPYGMFG
ncbi:hypothetical protein [Cyanobacterium aponinum]|uniref:Uncharacterized protein n=1 Tax=Cyanobacterium aponinum 0216 TaxID=2676140 RepID=A0A844H3L5_9CHRO|nr:hypothetical protein [Cyanobacterium aponinum]MTF40746.1 hypothetical protein [Cyanobacterium aponinum 0216]